MGVKVKGRTRMVKATLTCDVEGCKVSKTYTVQRNAATELTACETAHAQDGWGYTIGFWAMLLGHQVMCPDHAKGSEPAPNP